MLRNESGGKGAARRSLRYLFMPGGGDRLEERATCRSNRLILICMALGVLLYCYFDSRLLTVSAVNFWELIWEGLPRDFYAYQEANPLDFSIYTGGIVALLPRALWNFPNFILFHYFHLDYSEIYVCLIWGKLYQLLFFAWALAEVVRIAEMLNFREREIRRALYLFFGSIWIYANAFYGGVTESVWIALSLCSFRLLLVERRKASLVLAVLSSFAKPFFLPAYLLLLVSTERRWLRLISRSILLVAPLILERLLLVYGFSRYSELMKKSGVQERFLEDLRRFSLSFSGFSISFLLLITGGILLYALLTPRLDVKRDWEIVVFRMSLIYLTYFLLTSSGFYRPMMLFPWVCLLAAKRGKHYPTIVLVDMVLAVLGPLSFILRKEPLFDLIAFNRSFLLPNNPAQLSGKRLAWSFELFDFLGGEGSVSYFVMGTLIALGLLLVFVLLRPCRRPDGTGPRGVCALLERFDLHMLSPASPRALRAVLVLRTLTVPLWIGVSLVVYFA